MDDNKIAPQGEDETAGQRFHIQSLSDEEINKIKDDLVRAVVERAKSVESDMHSSHGNVHSSNNSGAI